MHSLRWLLTPLGSAQLDPLSFPSGAGCLHRTWCEADEAVHPSVTSSGLRLMLISCLPFLRRDLGSWLGFTAASCITLASFSLARRLERLYALTMPRSTDAGGIQVSPVLTMPGLQGEPPPRIDASSCSILSHRFRRSRLCESPGKAARSDSAFRVYCEFMLFLRFSVAAVLALQLRLAVRFRP